MHLLMKGGFTLSQLTQTLPPRGPEANGREYQLECMRQAQCATNFVAAKASFKAGPPTPLSAAHTKIIEAAATRVTPLTAAQEIALAEALAAKAKVNKDIELMKRARDFVPGTTPRPMTDGYMHESIAAFDAAEGETAAALIAKTTGIYHSEFVFACARTGFIVSCFLKNYMILLCIINTRPQDLFITEFPSVEHHHRRNARDRVQLLKFYIGPRHFPSVDQRGTRPFRFALCRVACRH